MTNNVYDQSKTLTKGDPIDIVVDGEELGCTVEVMIGGLTVVAKTPDDELVVAIPSRISADHWVDIHSEYDAFKSMSWSQDRNFEVGELVEIDMQVDGEKGGERKTVLVLQSTVIEAGAGVNRFAAPDYPSADGEGRQVTQEEIDALMGSATHFHVRAIGD